ncbi:MAG: polyphosphate polymerase domain-containing protein [Desulfobulbaceae bacterium]|nr:polyphosphate polymerase domain-containing protein [Desulfobulbaceae bacterium]
MAPLVPEDARREIKFVTRRSHYEQLKDWLFHNQAFFRIAYPDRAVNNIYFDTHNYDAYDANLSGRSGRTKVRYRWYGKDPQPEAGKLEIKHKRNMFGWKTLFPIPVAPWHEHISWINLKRIISDHLPIEGKLWLQHHPVPIIINRYEREYYLSSDGLVRVTIDKNQTVLDQRRKSQPNLTMSVALPDIIIVEIKFHRSERERASEIIQGIPIRASAYSKYVSGVHAVSGNNTW